MKNYLQWSAVFASYFAVMGVWTAFGPAALMASAPKVAPIALSAMTLTYFVATPFARKVWRALGFSRAVLVLGGGMFASLSASAIRPDWLAWCVPLAFFFGSGTYTVCETKMLEDLARTGRGHEFGRARKWGSFGFLAAAALGGAAFSVGGVGRSFSLSLAVGAGVFFACCFALSRASAWVADRAEPVSPAQVPDAKHTAALAAMEPQAAGGTTCNRLMGCAAVAGMRLAEAVSTAWFGAYWLHTGHSPFETGLLCALPVGAEFLAMWKGGRFVARFSAPAMMLICCAASVVRWAGTPFCSDLWCAVPLQSLHAFTFGFFYPASLLWLKQVFGDGFFDARYLTEAGTRAVNAVVTFAAAGWVIASYGYAVLFALSLALALLSGIWWLRVVRAATESPQGR